MESAMQTALDDGQSAGRAYDAIENAQVRELRDDSEYRATLRNAYVEAGVTLVSPTMGSLDRSISYTQGVHEDLARWQARFDDVPRLRKATTPAQAREIVADGDVGVVPTRRT